MIARSGQLAHALAIGPLTRVRLPRLTVRLEPPTVPDPSVDAALADLAPTACD